MQGKSISILTFVVLKGNRFDCSLQEQVLLFKDYSRKVIKVLIIDLFTKDWGPCAYVSLQCNKEIRVPQCLEIMAGDKKSYDKKLHSISQQSELGCQKKILQNVSIHFKKLQNVSNHTWNRATILLCSRHDEMSIVPRWGAMDAVQNFLNFALSHTISSYFFLSSFFVHLFQNMGNTNQTQPK